MSTMRLTFLYPHLFRNIKPSSLSHAPRQYRAPKVTAGGPSGSGRRCIATSSKRHQQFAPRHGKGVERIEPGEIEDGAKVAGPETLQKAESPEGRKTLEQEAAQAHAAHRDVVSESEAKPEAKEEKKDEGPDLSSSAPLSEETQAAARIPGDIGSAWMSPEMKEGRLRQAKIEEAGRLQQEFGKPIPKDTTPATGETPSTSHSVLLMDPPLEKSNHTGNPELPHLVSPPYVHHFDSYSLVTRLEDGGYSPNQAVESMKIVRALLAQNLHVAQHGLVSKSDVENETYLFQAACSELRTEIQNARKTNDEKMRMQRTILQHEVDILNQKLTQDLAGLKEDLRGMFNDRKMEVRMEQRNVESAIQEINYKITVALNSDSKSEVEGVRWILTRRSVLAIVFMAVVVLSSLRLASYRSHEAAQKQKEKEKKEAEDKRVKAVKISGGGTQTEEVLLGAEGLSST